MCLACYCLTMEAGQEIDFFFLLLLLPINTVMHRLAMVCFSKKQQISDPVVWSRELFFVWSSSDAPLYIQPYPQL